ncbi:hypothetical protein FD41_GL002108 [Lentilactobacillus farraginis DSM 18382 = JCM 14108]|uniref:Uncharacterized protein n=1 Tax=Lentilactobacillus farraginis DSM 18382 = JCM 14108 TaxID=1423743 RepID=X0PC10_9LACO|nr:hypothetical protein FD41_GL002108 [Lentilactobacillus farraginis DSM 18382 = JCM 14108]GAF37683.1 hypothetical protein JCM14108_2739 [Lentilactobacillus farraginis DSM 18382 = JCM 14108]
MAIASLFFYHLMSGNNQFKRKKGEQFAISLICGKVYLLFKFNVNLSVGHRYL